MGQFVHIDKRNIQFFSHIAWRIQISSVGIYQLIAFLNSRGCILIYALTNIILTNGTGYDSSVCRTKVTTYDGVKQYRNSSLSTCFCYETTQVGIKCCAGICMSLFIGLFIIMTKLDEDIISFFYL